jgi:hypothetical protein
MIRQIRRFDIETDLRHETIVSLLD